MGVKKLRLERQVIIGPPALSSYLLYRPCGQKPGVWLTEYEGEWVVMKGPLPKSKSINWDQVWHEMKGLLGLTQLYRGVVSLSQNRHFKVYTRVGNVDPTTIPYSVYERRDEIESENGTRGHLPGDQLGVVSLQTQIHKTEEMLGSQGLMEILAFRALGVSDTGFVNILTCEDVLYSVDENGFKPYTGVFSRKGGEAEKRILAWGKTNKAVVEVIVARFIDRLNSAKGKAVVGKYSHIEEFNMNALVMRLQAFQSLFE